MPAYFDVGFQYSKKANAVQPIVGNFYNALIQCGLSFKGGYGEAEKDSLEDIIQWNQKKLNENFQCGDTEHVSHDYKQVLFDFCEFSEVRVFLQNIRESDSVFFWLIIPEDDFVTYDLAEANGYYHRCNVVRYSDKMSIVEEFAIHMWEIGFMNSIQTGWEGSSFPPLFDEILQGAQPNIEPFCIIPKDAVQSEWNGTPNAIGHNGILLRNDKNWFF